MSTAFEHYVSVLDSWSRAGAALRRGTTNIAATQERGLRSSMRDREQTQARVRRLEQALEHALAAARDAVREADTSALLDGLAAAVSAASAPVAEEQLQQTFVAHRDAAAELVAAAHRYRASRSAPRAPDARPAPRRSVLVILAAVVLATVTVALVVTATT